MNFQDKLKQGKLAEGVIARWLIAQGFTVLPIYEIAEGQYKGPRLYSANGEFTGPDLTAFRGRHFMFVEAKSKTCWTWSRRCNDGKGQFETGIDRHHFRDYLALWQRLERPDFVLFFLQRSDKTDSRDVIQGAPSTCPTGLWGAELPILQITKCHEDSNWGAHGMVYWAQTGLRCYATLDDLERGSGMRLSLIDEQSHIDICPATGKPYHRWCRTHNRYHEDVERGRSERWAESCRG